MKWVFAVLTVLISVLVNDSAPSLGTHRRGGWVRGTGSKDGACKIKNDSGKARSLHTAFLLFWFNFKFLSTYPALSLSLFSYFLFHKSLSAPPTPPNSPQTFKSGLMFGGDELLSSAVWVGWQGSSLCREEPEAIGVHGHVHGRRQRLNFTAQDSPTLKWRELNGLKMGMTTPSDYTRLRAYLRILAASVDHSLQNKPGFLPTDIYTRHCEQM